MYIISYSCDQAGEYNCKISQVTNNGEVVISILLTKSVFVNLSRVPVVIQQTNLIANRPTFSTCS